MHLCLACPLLLRFLLRSSAAPTKQCMLPTSLGVSTVLLSKPGMTCTSLPAPTANFLSYPSTMALPADLRKMARMTSLRSSACMTQKVAGARPFQSLARQAYMMGSTSLATLLLKFAGLSACLVTLKWCCTVILNPPASSCAMR